MKEERMAILNMLEKGIITVDEAERLLNTLHNGMGLEKDGIGKAVGSALEKAGAALGSVAKSVGEKAHPVVKSAADKVSDKADEIQPKVRSAAFRMTEKIADKADEMQPKMRSAAFRMNEKAHAFKEDMANYREKLKAKHDRDSEEDWDDFDMEALDLEENSEKTSFTESAAETLDAMGVPKTTIGEEEETEEPSPEVEGYLKGVENVLDAVQTQMEQIDDAENFLKSAFGDVDPSEWEDDDDEDEKPAEEKPEE